MAKFIIKKIKDKPISRKDVIFIEKSLKKEEINKESKTNKVMNTKEKIELAKKVIENENDTPKVKKVRKDKGLIERTESSVTILTEDNRELLKD